MTKKGDATRDRSRDNTKGIVQYLVTYGYTNNNCLLSTSNITISVAIPTVDTSYRHERETNIRLFNEREKRLSWSDSERTELPCSSPLVHILLERPP